MDDSSCLIIVDVQIDFCPGGSLAVPDGDRIIPQINGIIGRFPVVVVTMDWHPEGHISFASSHAGKKVGDLVDTRYGKQYLWPDHCVREESGARLHPGLDATSACLILRKGMSLFLDSYSAFFENDRKTATGLEGYLKNRGVKRAYVCGLAMDYCVFYSAMDSVGLGFETIILNDCSAGVDVPAGNLKASLDSMKNAGISFKDSEEI